MIVDLITVRGPAIVACVIVGQVFLTVWFTVLFGDPWAKTYGVDDKKQHAREIPGYTYALGAACVLLLSLGLATLQAQLQVGSIAEAVGWGAFVALFFSVATALPGYAFLKRWRAFALAIGSQVSLTILLSLVLALWPQ